MPSLSAPIDEHLLIPHPPRSPWTALFWAIVAVGGAVLVLGFAFLRASAFH